ncbi:hypothetical protein AMI01nite_58180 [Aneurinibacillus migulanus]|nr:hypothetical protein AMI01nite_58180 [Aneurinibacillus migulanus]
MLFRIIHQMKEITNISKEDPSTSLLMFFTLEMKLFRRVFTVYLHLRQGFLDTRNETCQKL